MCLKCPDYREHNFCHNKDCECHDTPAPKSEDQKVVDGLMNQIIENQEHSSHMPIFSTPKVDTKSEEGKVRCQCSSCKIKPHWSDCAVHNEPAERNGECNCCGDAGKYQGEDFSKCPKHAPKEDTGWVEEKEFEDKVMEIMRSADEGNDRKYARQGIELIKYFRKTLVKSISQAKQEVVKENFKFLGTFFGENIYIETQNPELVEKFSKYMEDFRIKALKIDDELIIKEYKK